MSTNLGRGVHLTLLMPLRPPLSLQLLPRRPPRQRVPPQPEALSLSVYKIDVVTKPYLLGGNLCKHFISIHGFKLTR